MSATGLEVFDRTLQVTNTWLDEMMETLPRDRKLAWHVLGTVLRTTTETTMTTHPPVPPDNQSHKGTGDPKTGNAHQVKKGRSPIENPREQGQAGNTAQNTTHQGYQQDR